MHFRRNTRSLASLAVGCLTFCQTLLAQEFAYSANDLILGFRKTGAYQANHELVVRIGWATNYLALAPGDSVAVPNYTPSLLSASVGDFSHLNWSVLGVAGIVGDPPAGYPQPTLWVTVPRTNVDVKTTAPKRMIPSATWVTAANVVSILEGAVSLSRDAGTSNDFNNLVLLREPVNDPSNLSAFVASRFDTTASSLQDSWTPNVECITPADFSGPVRSDLYEARPEGELDPHTGKTSGDAYHIGYFQLNPDGTMTFTRAGGAEPPPAPELAITRSGNTCTISFVTANGASYRLYHTSLPDLTQPLSQWTAVETTITGDGQPKSFTDLSSETSRVYRVIAQ